MAKSVTTAPVYFKYEEHGPVNFLLRVWSICQQFGIHLFGIFLQPESFCLYFDEHILYIPWLQSIRVSGHGWLSSWKDPDRETINKEHSALSTPCKTGPTQHPLYQSKQSYFHLSYITGKISAILFIYSFWEVLFTYKQNDFQEGIIREAIP